MLTYCPNHASTPMQKDGCFQCNRTNTILTNPLAWLEKLGRGLARSADPSTYSYERRRNADPYKPMLLAARLAYASMRNGEDPLAVFKSLRPVIQTGVERNHIELAIGILSRAQEEGK